MKQTVLGNIKSQPEVLKYTLDNQNVFVDPFVEVFKKHDIKKVFFFGSGTSYNVSQIAAYYFKHIVGIDASAQYPTVYQNYEKPDWTGMLKMIRSCMWESVSQEPVYLPARLWSMQRRTVI